MESLSFVVRKPRAEPFEPVGKARGGSFEGGNTESRALKPYRDLIGRGLPFSPSGNFDRALIDEPSAGASEIRLSPAPRSSSPGRGGSRRACRSRSTPARTVRRSWARVPPARAGRRIFARIAEARMRVRSGPGLTSMTRIAEVLTVSRRRCGQARRAPPWKRRRAPIGEQLCAARRARSDKYRPPGLRLPQQGVEGADQPPIRRDVDRHDLFPLLRVDVVERRQWAQCAGIADKNVEAPPALVQRFAEPVDGGKVAQIARRQRGGRLDVGAQRPNLVVELSSPPWVRASATTWQPAAASARAAARPIPREAPVTRATRVECGALFMRARLP